MDSKKNTVFQSEKLFITDKLAYRYFKKLASQKGRQIDGYHIMNDYEIAAIKKIYWFTIFMASLWGTLGVLFLYIPQYIFPELFPIWNVSISLISNSPIPISIVSIIYGVILVVVEIALLTIYNLKAVQKIAFHCGFPILHDPDYEQHINDLFRLGTEKPNKDQLIYGINPYEGLPAFQIMILNILNSVKATASGIIAKILLSRFLGRYALREYLDLSGIPIFAFWNALAAHLVMKETKIRIMGTSIIPLFINQLDKQIADKETFKQLLADLLQLIAIVKRKFHHNHYLLIRQIIKRFKVEINRKEALNVAQLLEKADHIDKQTQKNIMKLVIFGMMLDGKLSRRDEKMLKEFEGHHLLFYSINDIKTWTKNFAKGKGLDTFIQS